MRVKSKYNVQINLRYQHAVRFALSTLDLLNTSNQAKKVQNKVYPTPAANTDKDIDRIFRAWVLDRFPNDRICSEEGAKELDNQSCWIVDPLDGAANFANGRLQYAVSIGYWNMNMPTFGVIVTPLFNGFSIISALESYGIHINGKRHKPSVPEKLIGGIGFRPDIEDVSRDAFPKLLDYTDGEMRVIGSIACGLTEVALGRLSFYVHSGPRIWEVAAGLALLRTANKTVNLKNINLSKLASPDYRLPLLVVSQTRAILSEVLDVIRS